MRLPLTRILQSAILCAAFLTPSMASAQDITSGLVGHWKLDEKSGSVIADSSENGKTGTWRDDVNDDVAEETIAGQEATALQFDGVNDRIFISTNPELLEGETEGSICLWARHTGAITRDHTMVSKFAEGTGIYMWVDDSTSILGNADSVSFAADTGGGPGGRVEGTASLVSDGTWDHYCGTFKGNTFIRLYKNGILNAENTTSIVSTFANAPSPYFRIGDSEASGNTNFTGSLDDVRIYHRALTSGEITALYNATK